MRRLTPASEDAGYNNRDQIAASFLDLDRETPY